MPTAKSKNDFLPLFTIPQLCSVCEPNHYYMVCSAIAIQVNCPGPNLPFNIWSSVHMPVNALNAIYTSTCFVLTECQAYLILWEVLTVDLCLRGYSIKCPLSVSKDRIVLHTISPTEAAAASLS